MSQPHSASAYVGPDYPRWTHTLPDGRQVLIRPICRQDAAGERRFVEELSPASRRNRFLGQMVHLSDEFVERLTDIDYLNDVALAAVVREGDRERIVGVARYAVDASRERCESAVVVADDWQRMGLGTALMRRLIGIAQGRGLRRMESTDLSENLEMHALAHDLGFDCRPDPDDARQVVYSLPLGSGSRAGDA